MIGEYRQTRNVEKSLIEAIRVILPGNYYDNVTVVKSFKQANKVGLNSEEKNAIICVRVSNTIHEGAEVGSNLTKRKPLAIIDIFGTSDGQIRDIKDLLISELKSGIDYYEYTVIGGDTSDATYESGETTNGRLIVDDIFDEEINFGEDKAQLDIMDRCRWKITLHISKTKLEG